MEDLSNVSKFGADNDQCCGSADKACDDRDESSPLCGQEREKSPTSPRDRRLQSQRVPILWNKTVPGTHYQLTVMRSDGQPSADE